MNMFQTILYQTLIEVFAFWYLSVTSAVFVAF